MVERVSPWATRWVRVGAGVVRVDALGVVGGVGVDTGVGVAEEGVSVGALVGTLVGVLVGVCSDGVGLLVGGASEQPLIRWPNSANPVSSGGRGRYRWEVLGVIKALQIRRNV